MTYQLLKVDFPQHKLETQDDKYLPADAYLQVIYKQVAWYCAEARALYIFTTDTPESIREALDKVMDASLDRYQISVVSSSNVTLPEDTHRWVQQKIEALQQLQSFARTS